MGRLELIGAEVLTAKMLSLPHDIRTAVEKSALKEANELVVDALRGRIATEFHDTGALSQAVKHDIRKTKDGNALIGRVGIDYNQVGTVTRNSKNKRVFKKNKNATGNNVRRPARYWHLMNLGTQGYTTETRKKPGAIKGKNIREEVITQLAPLIEKLFENAANEALRK